MTAYISLETTFNEITVYIEPWTLQLIVNHCIIALPPPSPFRDARLHSLPKHSDLLIFVYDQVKIHDTVFVEKLCRLTELQHVLEATLVHFLHFRNHHMPAIQPIEKNQDAICDLEQRGGGRYGGTTVVGMSVAASVEGM